MIIEHTFNICILISLSLVLSLSPVQSRDGSLSTVSSPVSRYLFFIYRTDIHVKNRSGRRKVDIRNVYKCSSTLKPPSSPPIFILSLPWRYIFNHCHCAFFYFIQRSVLYFAPRFSVLSFASRYLKFL